MYKMYKRSLKKRSKIGYWFQDQSSLYIKLMRLSEVKNKLDDASF